jgi:thiopurine S-methyltransferase
VNSWNLHLQWTENQIGFHNEDVNDVLIKFGESTILSPNDETLCAADASSVRVLVPLCGKTVDMAFLASHPSVGQVIGIEGIRKALEDFAKEQPQLDISPSLKEKDASSSHSENEEEEEEEEEKKFDYFHGNNIMLLKGDFFALNDQATKGKVDSIWDRASMVAIHPSLREAYVHVLHQVLKPGGTILLVTLERRTGTEEGKATGPPFSISEQEVRRLYESQPWVESVSLIQERDEFARNPEKDNDRFRSSGVTSMFELVFKITTRSE